MTTPPPPSSPAREQRLLEAVLALETENQRRAFLASLDDPDQRRRLEELLMPFQDGICDQMLDALPIEIRRKLEEEKRKLTEE